MAIVQRQGGNRIEVRWPVRIHHPAYGCAEGKTVNLSTVDILFISPQRYPLWDPVQLEIQIGPEERVACVVSLKREEPASMGRYGYGAVIVRFCEGHGELLAKRLSEMGGPGVPNTGLRAA